MSTVDLPTQRQKGRFSNLWTILLIGLFLFQLPSPFHSQVGRGNFFYCGEKKVFFGGHFFGQWLFFLENSRFTLNCLLSMAVHQGRNCPLKSRCRARIESSLISGVSSILYLCILQLIGGKDSTTADREAKNCQRKPFFIFMKNPPFPVSPRCQTGRGV